MRIMALRRSSPSASLCALSFITFVIGSLLAAIGLATRPMGSHSMPFVAVLVAGVAMGVGVWAFLECPRRPSRLKLLSVVLAALNIWLGLASAVGYLNELFPSFRIWTMSFSRALQIQ